MLSFVIIFYIFKWSFPNCNHVSAIVWQLNRDYKEALEEKVRWKLYEDAASWFEQTQEAAPFCGIHLILFLILIYLAGFSGLSGNSFGLSWVYLGLRVYFYSFKSIQRFYLVFDVFIRSNSHVNRTAGIIVILGVRLDYSN